MVIQWFLSMLDFSTFIRMVRIVPQFCSSWRLYDIMVSTMISSIICSVVLQFLSIFISAVDFHNKIMGFPLLWYNFSSSIVSAVSLTCNQHNIMDQIQSHLVLALIYICLSIRSASMAPAYTNPFMSTKDSMEVKLEVK